MIGRLWQKWRNRRDVRARATLDALKVRYHTFRILLANHERALARLEKVASALAEAAPADELAGLVEDALAVTFEMVDGVTRLAADGARALYARQLRLEEALRAALDVLDAGGRGPSCLPLALPLEPGQVGGKAAGLSALTRNGFPVPDGFAVTARACREFLRETALDTRIRQALREAGAADAALAGACEAIRRDILAAPLPAWLRSDLQAAAAALTPAGSGPLALAARSSALTEDRPEHSFAGQYATELNLSPETLGQGFSKVMAGAFTERAVAYRLEAGLPAATLDMAVLVQVMVPAVAAGVVFTVDPVRPVSGRMLVTAVPGLGILAVNGSVPVDIYRVDRDDPTDAVVQPARKTRRAVSDPAGGIRREAVPAEQQKRAVLETPALARLARLSLAAEALAGSYRDLEYAVDAADSIWLLQSRPARIAWGGHRPTDEPRELLRGGMTAVAGRCLGRVRQVTGETPPCPEDQGPVIAVLPTATPEAARWLSRCQGMVVAAGNPGDHLSILARETGRPLLTRASGALSALADGSVAVLDAGENLVTDAPAAIGDLGDLLCCPPATAHRLAAASLSPSRARIRDLVVPLTLSDVSGPAFTAKDCHTLRDSIRFAHETAVMSLLKDEDSLLDTLSPQIRVLGKDTPAQLLVIDLGGGVREEAAGQRIEPGSVASLPLAALWQGLANAGQPGQAPPAQTPSGAKTDGARPEYALAARDYVNVSSRQAGHSLLIDAVCGPHPGRNYARLRFRATGPDAPRRDRLAANLAGILQAAGFSATRQDNLVTASLTDIPETATSAAVALLGRLLGQLRQPDTPLAGGNGSQDAVTAFFAGEPGRLPQTG